MTQKTLSTLICIKKQEQLLIDSGAVYRLINASPVPISDVEIAMQLEISIPSVRSAIAQLLKDNLIKCDRKERDHLTTGEIEF